MIFYHVSSYHKKVAYKVEYKIKTQHGFYDEIESKISKPYIDRAFQLISK